MDPITAAIIAALTAAITEVGKQSVVDAYTALKSMLARRYGARSSLIKTIDDLEKSPTPQAHAAVLQQAVKNARADQDQALVNQAYYLSQQVNRSRSYQYVYGNNNILQQAGRNAYYASGRGSITNARDINRLGPIVFLVIALVAIFAFLIWQAFSLLHSPSGPGSSPALTQIPTYPPGNTIIDLCQFARAGRPDWAYQVLTTESFKNHVSSSDFTNQWNGMDFDAQCTLSNPNISGDTATGDLTVQRSTGTSHYAVRFKKMLTTDSQGKTAYGWFIDDLQPK